ncbi:MAG: DUF885 domain-containing protein, partial [Gemmatimonadota bacterium]
MRRNPRPGPCRLLPCLLFAALACDGSDGNAPPRPGDPIVRLDALADRYWRFYLEAHPLEATYLGVERVADRVPDITPAGRADREARLDTFRAQLAAIDGAALDGQSRLTYLALEQELRREAAERTCAAAEWSVDHRNGPQIAFLNIASVQPVETPEDGERLLRRWSAMADYLDDHVANLRAGRERGRTPARPGVVRTLAQVDGLLARPIEAWPLYAPLHRLRRSWSPEERERFRASLYDVLATRLWPAFVRLRDFLRDEMRPVARTGEQAGLGSLPGGPACYEALVRAFTTLPLSPEEVHEMGAREIARIRERMEEVGARAFGLHELAAIQARLR